MLALLLGLLTAHAKCPYPDEPPASAAEVEAALDRLDAVTGEAELERFAQAAVTAADCLGEPATPAIAARYHLASALWKDPAGFYSAAKPDTRAVPHLAAAFAISPALRHTAPAAPTTHFSSLDFPAPESEVAPAPLSGTMYFDGMESLDRPTNMATFLQITDDIGAVWVSEVVYPGEELPPYPSVPSEEVAPSVLPTVSPLQATKSLRGPLRVAALGMGALALGALGSNLALGSAALDPTNSTEENARSKQGIVNGLGVAAIVLGAGAGGSLGASLVVK